MIAYYRIADAFVCMSEEEGFGMALVEAMFYHVPVVAYESGAVPGAAYCCRPASRTKSQRYWIA